MFQGTVNKHNPQHAVMVVTREDAWPDMEAPPPNIFRLLILESGSLAMEIDGESCFFEAPAILCLDEKKTVIVRSKRQAAARLILFDPVFLNTNMQIGTIRSLDYAALCDQHAFFQLSPFLTQDIGRLSFRPSEETLHKIQRSFDEMTRNLEEQADWYWSCRARSYFIDIISILERIFHDYYLDDAKDACLNAVVPKEFRLILEYINTHLDERLTLDSLYLQFHICKNRMEELFKEYLGITFYAYLKKRRYEEAAYYLRFTELDGEQIAARIGLSSSQNFCKFFRAFSGLSPNRFRKEAVSKRRHWQTIRQTFTIPAE